MIKRYAEQILINTKMNRPTIVDKSVLRPRLLARLDEGLQKRMTLISAAAGFGKTTLAVQWLEQNPGLSAWLSLEKDDSDPEIFLRYLVAAIQSIVPSFGKQVWSLLSAVRLPPPNYLADSIITELTSLSEPLLIVLDDYHLIVSDDVQKIVNRILTHLPDKVHMTILTRKDPPWPIARWRTMGWINELRAADLNFSKEETKTLVVENNLSPGIADILYRQTEGWIAGLRLLLISLSDTEDPDQFAQGLSSNDHLIVDFLMEEVISHQPGEVLDFLAVSSMFDRFCAPLCDFLLADVPDRKPGDQIIARLERENLFLVQLDRERSWYRYHHFFQMLLEKHLQVRMTRERLHYLYRRAGEWFAGQAMIEEAIKCYISAGDIDAAARLLAENLHTLIYRDMSRRILMRWLKMFPSGAEKQHPALLVAHACYKTYTWELAGLLSLLDSAQDLLQDPRCPIDLPVRRILQANIDGMYGFCFYWQGDLERSLHHALRALHAVPRDHHWAYMLAIFYTAGSQAATGNYEEAMQFISEKLLEDHSAGSLNVGQILALKAGINCYAGNLDGVREAADKALESHQMVPLPDYWLLHAYYFLGAVAYERNLLDSAVNYFSHVERMIYQVNTRIYHDCMIGLALAAWAGKAQEKAWEYAKKARSFAVAMNDPTSLQLSDSLITRLSLFAGKVPDEPDTGRIGHDSNKFWLEIPGLTRAEYLINRSPEDCTKAISFIEEALLRARECHNTRQVIQFMAVKAVALKCAGRSEEALRVLHETLAMAGPLGFVRTFIDRGSPMADLLTVLLKKKPRDRYVRSLLIAFNTEKAQHERTDDFPDKSRREKSVQATDSTLQDELTNREIEILLLLEQRLSNKEISSKLFISPETVRKHSINIYHKLKVNNRRAAVIAARNYGLIGSQYPAS